MLLSLKKLPKKLLKKMIPKTSEKYFTGIMLPFLHIDRVFQIQCQEAS